MAIGGKLFDQASGRVREELLVCLLCAIAVAAMLVPTLTSSHLWILGAFFTFEVRLGWLLACVKTIVVIHCVSCACANLVLWQVVIGVFSPCCATLRSRYFPAEGLSNTLGHFRLPTNILVVLGTGGANHLSTDQLFASCSAVLAFSTLCGARLLRTSRTPASSLKKRD